MRTILRPVILVPLLVPFLCGCAGLGRGGTDGLVVDTDTGYAVPLEEVADELAATCDVVFIGEQHDSDPGHDLQFSLTKMLYARRGDIAISMEMFERDNQAVLDRYLAGEIDEDTFLEEARFWSNYAEHYRPAIELARRAGLPVLAGNIPRPLAARVVKEGINAVLGEEYTPRQAHVAAGEYKRQFREVMGEHGEGMEQADFDNLFAAQCIKDDAMSESIADFLIGRSSPRPLVVHWVGAFHSDYGLGTVERLRQRMPGLRIAVLSTVKKSLLSSPLDEADRGRGRWVFVVKP